MQGLKIILFGKVQKVGLRNSLLKLTKELNLKGYIKNLADGSVDITLLDFEHDPLFLIEKIKQINSRVLISSFEFRSCLVENFEDFKILE